MQTKILSKALKLALVSAMSVSVVFAADFSKTSEKELIELSGKVAPKDYPDYKIELHKRILEMKVKDAKEFQQKLRNAKKEAFEKNTPKQNREYQKNIRIEVQKRLDTMSIKEARESGLMREGFRVKANKGMDSQTTKCNNLPKRNSK